MRKLLRYRFLSLLKDSLFLWPTQSSTSSAWKYKPTAVADTKSKPSISPHNQRWSPKTSSRWQHLSDRTGRWDLTWCKAGKATASQGWVMYFPWLASFRNYQVLTMGDSPLKIMLMVLIHSLHRGCFLFGNSLPREVYMKFLLWKTAPEKVVGRGRSFHSFLFLRPVFGFSFKWQFSYWTYSF